MTVDELLALPDAVPDGHRVLAPSPPKLFNVNDEIAAEPDLPGFRASVAEIFGD